MKKYLVILLAWMMVVSCTPDDSTDPVKYHYVGIKKNGLATTTSEDGGVFNIPVYFGGELVNDQSFEVGFTVTGGTYGTDYTIVGASSESGTVTISAGDLGSALGNIGILPTVDYDNESDFGLTVTLTSAPEGFSIGYPLSKSYSFTVKDDDCEFDFVGDLDGSDASMDLLGAPYLYDAACTIDFDGTTYTIDGLNTAWIADFWAETITDSSPVVFTKTAAGAITIADQYIFTTDYNGNPYVYHISGTGQVNSCDGNVTINYDLYNVTDDYSVAAYCFDSEWMSTPLFKAVLTPIP